MNIVCCSTKNFARILVSSSIRPRCINNLSSRAWKKNIIYHGETCYQLHTRARRKLERIHKKNEDIVTRSQEALKKLRKKKLEGLTESRIPEDVQLGEKLSSAKSIRKLLSIYTATNDSNVFTLSNQVITLKRIAELFEKHQEERAHLSEKLSHQKLVCELIDSVTDSCKHCTSKELLVVMTTLAHLGVKHYPIYAPIINEIQSQGFEMLDAEEIGLLCWALGVAAESKANKLMEEISEHLSQRELVTFSNTNLSQIAWSFSELAVPTDGLLKGLCSEILSRDLSLFEPRAITHLSLAFSRIDSLAERVMSSLEEALYPVIEGKKFPTVDLVSLTVSFLRSDKISGKMFRKLDKLLISRRDFEETVSKELLEEMLSLLKDSSFHLAEIRKVLENVLYPDQINSVFDVFFRPRRSWKAKMFKQSWFKVY